MEPISPSDAYLMPNELNQLDDQEFGVPLLIRIRGAVQFQGEDSGFAAFPTRCEASFDVISLDLKTGEPHVRRGVYTSGNLARILYVRWALGLPLIAGVVHARSGELHPIQSPRSIDKGYHPELASIYLAALKSFARKLDWEIQDTPTSNIPVSERPRVKWDTFHIADHQDTPLLIRVRSFATINDSKTGPRNATVADVILKESTDQGMTVHHNVLITSSLASNALMKSAVAGNPVGMWKTGYVWNKSRTSSLLGVCPIPPNLFPMGEGDSEEAEKTAALYKAKADEEGWDFPQE